MSNLPSRITEDQQIFTAVCKSDSNERFTIEAATEHYARVVLLDKIGYIVIEAADGTFLLVDADDLDMVIDTLRASSYVAALEESMTKIDWKLSEPTQLIGGSMGSGFGFEEQP